MGITAEQVKDLREKTGLGMMLCKKALTETSGDMEKAIENLRKQGETTAAKRAGKAANEGKVAIVTDSKTAIVYEVNCETDFVAKNEDFLAFVEELGKLLLAERPADLASATALTSSAFDGRSVEDRLTELIGKIGEKITFRRFEVVEYDNATEGVFSYIHGNGKIGVVVKISMESSAAATSDAASALGKDLAMQVAASSPVAVDRESFPVSVVDKEKDIYHTQAENSGKPEKIWDKIVQGKLNKFFAESALTEQVYIKDNEKKVSDRIEEAAKAAGSTIKVAGFVRYELGNEG